VVSSLVVSISLDYVRLTVPFFSPPFFFSLHKCFGNCLLLDCIIVCCTNTTHFFFSPFLLLYFYLFLWSWVVATFLGGLVDYAFRFFSSFHFCFTYLVSYGRRYSLFFFFILQLYLLTLYHA